MNNAVGSVSGPAKKQARCKLCLWGHKLSSGTSKALRVRGRKEMEVAASGSFLLVIG